MALQPGWWNLFFVGKEKVESTSSLQKREGKLRRRRQFRQMPHMIWISDLPVKHEEAPVQNKIGRATRTDNLRTSAHSKTVVKQCETVSILPEVVSLNP